MDREKRKVGVGLGLGVFLVPLIFSWFTLRQGHSAVSRVMSFGWLALTVLFVAASPSPEQTVASTSLEPQKQVAVVKASTKPKVEYQKVSINQIAKDYTANEARGDSLYKGKQLLVSGVVDGVDKDLFDDTVIHLAIDDNFIPASMGLVESQQNESKSIMLNKGEMIELLCTSTGEVMGSPTFKDCQFP